MMLRRQVMLAVVILAAAIGLVTTLVTLVTHHASPRQATAPSAPPVIGRSITPLRVYQRFSEQARSLAPVAHGERMVSEINKPGVVDIISRRSVVDLHVQYATVRGIGPTQWIIQFFAPEGASFTLASNSAKLFVAVLDHQALPLLFDMGVSDGSNFTVIAGTDEGEAISLAQQLTTSVTIEPTAS